MTSPARVVQIAANEVGYTEYPSGSNTTKYGQWYGMNHVPWCAIFVSYCFDQAGIYLPIRTPKGFAYCPDGVRWFQNQSQWYSQPQVGDLVFYCWRGDGVADHIGIVESVNSDGSIISIEGNTAIGNDSNGGEVMRRRRDPWSFLGFGRPYAIVQPVPQLKKEKETTNSPQKPDEGTKTAPDYHTRLVNQLLGKEKVN
ncbi:CHAP domain protein [Lyngbya aestuarii BL J]|uniref:CHAP domain protein n=1 Tax=Lyngbya aestuarii BL J TaxID=1348334 RepID=U7QEF4_9CYAN|nr:CHAP domain-containing protein [Lyngbya aestuarii]ERT06314.1 CHAP domain protein [Lyngbya aestuarii BL J]